MVLTAHEKELLFKIQQLEQQSQAYADMGLDQAALNCLERANQHKEKLDAGDDED